MFMGKFWVSISRETDSTQRKRRQNWPKNRKNKRFSWSLGFAQISLGSPVDDTIWYFSKPSKISSNTSKLPLCNIFTHSDQCYRCYVRNNWEWRKIGKLRFLFTMGETADVPVVVRRGSATASIHLVILRSFNILWCPSRSLLGFPWSIVSICDPSGLLPSRAGTFVVLVIHYIHSRSIAVDCETSWRGLKHSEGPWNNNEWPWKSHGELPKVCEILWVMTNGRGGLGMSTKHSKRHEGQRRNKKLPRRIVKGCRILWRTVRWSEWPRKGGDAHPNGRNGPLIITSDRQLPTNDHARRLNWTGRTVEDRLAPRRTDNDCE